MVMKIVLTAAYWANRLRCYLTRPLLLSVKLLLVRDRTVLLVKHSYQSGWHLPGGGVKRGETLEAAARREAREELGARLDDLRLVGVYTNLREHKSDHLAVFASESFSLHGGRDAEIERSEFFEIDRLPFGPDSGSRRRVMEYFEGQAPLVGPW